MAIRILIELAHACGYLLPVCIERRYEVLLLLEVFERDEVLDKGFLVCSSDLLVDAEALGVLLVNPEALCKLCCYLVVGL